MEYGLLYLKQSITNTYSSISLSLRVGADEEELFFFFLSTERFSLYSEMAMRCIEAIERICMGGQNVNYVIYSDDTVLIAGTQEKVQDIW